MGLLIYLSVNIGEGWGRSYACGKYRNSFVAILVDLCLLVGDLLFYIVRKGRVMRKEIDFISGSKRYFVISIGLMVVALLFALLFGVQLDIEFKGGTILTYAYSGDINQAEFEGVVEEQLGESVSVQSTVDVVSGSRNYVVSLARTDGIEIDTQIALTDALTAKYPDNNIEIAYANVVDAVIGGEFLMKSFTAVVFASALMIVYVALRFKVISGLSAGVTAVIALLHDVFIVFAVFVVFQIPLNDNFIAVILTILGYSLNDTIVIYDRVRENKRLHGDKLTTAELMNKSINQSLTRSIATTITTVLAMVVVSVVALMFNVTSILSFSFPIILGMLSGVYSSICIAGPLWVMWQDKKAAKAA